MNKELLRKLLLTVDDTKLDIADLPAVNDEVADSLASEWRGMCTALGLLNDNAIAKKFFHDPNDCLKEVLCQWLNQKYDTERHGLPTWKKLVEVVAKSAGGSNPALAEKIAENHKKGKVEPKPSRTVADSGEEEKGEKPKFTAADITGIIQNYKPESVPTDAAKKDQLVSFARKVVVILHTCNDNEYWAAIEKLEPPTGDNNQGLADCPMYHPDVSYPLGLFAGYKTAVVKTGQANECIEPLKKALTEYFPNAKVVIGVGIAYAKDKTLKYADVIISKHIEDCVQVKIQDGKIISRGSRAAVDSTVAEVFCSRELISWGVVEPFYCTDDDSRISSAESGCIISAPWLMRDQKKKEELFTLVPDAKGGEMEGWALLEVKKTKPVAVIIIKGVADYGDAEKGDNWQPTAAKAAVAFTHYHLKDTGGQRWK